MVRASQPQLISSERIAKRLQKELHQLITQPLDLFSVEYKEDDLYLWIGTMKGPPLSPFANGVFKIRIEIPEDYPRFPPKIKFETKIYHPCVDDNGYVALRFLSACNWVPVLTVAKLLLDIEVLLNDPQADIALVERMQVAVELDMDKEAFEETARQWTQEFAIDSQENTTTKTV